DIELEIIKFTLAYDDPLEAKSTKKRKAQQWIPWTLDILKHPIDLTNVTFNTFKEAIFVIVSKIDTKQPNGNAAILRQADIAGGLTIEAYVSGHNTYGQTRKTQNHITSQENLIAYLKAVYQAPLKPHCLTFRMQDPNKKKHMEKADLAHAQHGMLATNHEKGLGTSTFQLADVRSMDPEATFLNKLIKKHGTTVNNARERWHVYNKKDLSQFVQLDHQRMVLWARELAQEKAGVTLEIPPMYIEGWGWETLETVRPLTDSAPPTTDHETPCMHEVHCQKPPIPDHGLHPDVDTKKLGALRAATSLKEFLLFSGIPMEKVGTLVMNFEDIHIRSFDTFLYTRHINSSMLQTAGIPIGVAVAVLVNAFPFYLYLVDHEERQQITPGTAESSSDDGDVF
ncbi:hypothetical protein CROQUDRAFT_42018, partial [Cronartium quercuum f. sp. fusiforme G11]